MLETSRGMPKSRRPPPPPAPRHPASQAPAAHPRTQPAASLPPAYPAPACHPAANPGPAGHPLTHPSPSGPAACPQATHPLPGPLLTASHPPRSQGPFPSQPKPTMTPSQSEKSLETRDIFKNNSCAQEKGQIHVSQDWSNSKNINEKPKITPEDKNNKTYSQWNQVAGNNQLGLDSNQTSIPKTKIEVFEPKSCHHHLTTHPEEIIGPKQNCLKPQQIAQEQGFGHPFKHQFPIPMTKLLGTPVPCFYSHLQNFVSGAPLFSKPQARPASKDPTKRVRDPQSDYPVTQSQTRKSTQITKSINMNK
ncbi:hypothetical protein DSO57_1007227 [Entomophthora muscae]|uniref:Uncharacterized protein n=1 Tax=Entomophthora muscae TaxID=34485 RepID=A0ACC2TI34_9FUNG|nr:hypothetical protein DSO57_1007227 [Entomophthora muscae]